MIQSIRWERGDVILLDCGGILPNRKPQSVLSAETTLKAMVHMGYDAMSPGIDDLLNDGELLPRSRAYVTFPYVASNLRWDGATPPWVEEYHLIDRGGLRMAVIGLVTPRLFSEGSVPKGVSTEVPAASLKRIMAILRGKAEVTVLLSGMGYDETLALVDGIEGIDIAICVDEGRPSRAGTGGRTHLVLTGYKAMDLGLLTLVMGDDGGVSVIEDRHLSLDDSVHDDDAINVLIGGANSP